MFGVDFGDDHGDVVGEAVRGVVGDHGDLQLGVALLERAHVFFFHIDGAEDEIHLPDEGSRVVFRVKDHHVRDVFGDRRFHRPLFLYRFAIRFPRGARACQQGCGRKPRM